jgi:hypothetical protein
MPRNRRPRRSLVSTPTTPRRAAFAAGLALVLLAVLVPALPAAAASWSCDASAARTAFATAPPAEPVTANRSAASCTGPSAGGAAALAGLPAPLTGATLGAATDLQPAGATPDQQVATATATVSNLRVLPLPGQIPAPAIPPGLASFAIPGGPAVDLTRSSRCSHRRPSCSRSTRSRAASPASAAAGARRSPARRPRAAFGSSAATSRATRRSSRS